MSTTSSQSAGRKPSHRLYRVDGDCDDASWTPIGAAWPHRDGDGYSIVCEAMPLGGRLVLRVAKDRSEAA